ncbi:hypothetical protein MPSEU_000089500 [Mayamaea pseudoterrestris]|nr:hypothetical protein MPSEU_000089500 [Mayamaea pseudoterrestris]
MKARLFRDCLRLIKHVSPGAASPKSMALRSTVRSEFRKPYASPKQIEAAKQNAVRALANYLLATAAPKDPNGVGGAMKDFYKRSAKEAKQEQVRNQQQQQEP